MINTVGVIGAGTMGAALAQKFAQEGFTVILADRTMNFVENGLRWKKEPIEMMKEIGADEVKRLAAQTAGLYNMKLPGSLSEKHWQTAHVKLEKKRVRNYHY